MEDLDPAVFGERLLPGHGDDLADAWRAMSIYVDDPDQSRHSAAAMRMLANETELETGDLEGLLFGDPRRYLEDLALQLELWSSILDLKHATGDSVRLGLRRTVNSLQAWNDRHGFRDRYHDVYYYSHVHPVYRQALEALGTPEAIKAAELTDMFRGPQHGRTLELLDAMRAAAK